MSDIRSAIGATPSYLGPGVRIEVWSDNKKIETIYTKTQALLNKYVQAERQYIREKQANAEKRNQLRRARANERAKR